MIKFLSAILLGLVLVTNNVSAETTINTFAPQNGCFALARSMSLGSKGDDVLALQRFLNSYTDTTVAVSGPGSFGYETSYFGPATKRAVIKFQNKYNADILLPAGLKIGNGFVGTLTRARILKFCKGQTQSDVVFSVTTDKNTYNQNEKINISIKAENTTNKEKILNFNSGCQVAYSIGGFNQENFQICTESLTSVKIPAMSSKVWNIEHDPANYLIPPASYDLIGKVIGIGEAKKAITITSATPIETTKVTSPNGGESWLLGSNHEIIWERTPHVTFVQAPRFDLLVVPEPPACASDPITPCLMPAYSSNYLIAQNVAGTGDVSKYTWKVGQVMEPSNTTLSKGKYKIMVCETPYNGGGSCVRSERAFTIR